ncbi:C40 family peptidase [Pedobacter gandavensis]|uniref:C40 family peptidase n=1 Tax=Pedobacter gandavensis TaxID=2679963 RepID=UPI0029311CA8|nr:C40 family peptidase [Pedobacter gandavensis]
MKKSIIIVLFLSMSTFAAKSQGLTPIPYQDMVFKLMEHLPALPASKLQPSHLLSFAKSMIGTRYRYASSNPKNGFDCSGFVNYVFRNFGINAPRSSRDFATKGQDKKLADAQVGDVIIFTGTNSRVRRVGHVGIISAVDGDEIKFIHSSSGAAKGVTITSLNDSFYKKRFMKVVSIL